MQVMSLTSSFYHLIFKCNLDLQPTTFFHKESKSKKKCVCVGGGGGGVGGAPGEGGRGGGVDGWTDEQAQTNLPLQLLRTMH